MASALTSWTLNDIIQQQNQAQALGQAGASPTQLSGVVSGALSADYQTAMQQSEQLQQYGEFEQSLEQQQSLATQQIAAAETQQSAALKSQEAMAYQGRRQTAEQMKAQEIGSAASGVGSLVGTAMMADAISKLGGQPGLFSSVGSALGLGGTSSTLTGAAVGAEGLASTGGAVAAGAGEAGAAVTAGVATTEAAADVAAVTATEAAVDVTAAAAVEGAADVGIGSYLADAAIAVIATIICTELHRQGKLSDELYKYDSLYGQTLEEEIMWGYRYWAIPLASRMRRSETLSRVVLYVGMPIIKEMAHRSCAELPGSFIGSLGLGIGLKICKWIAEREFKKNYIPIKEVI